MAWGKVDDKLHSSPKWLATPPAARALWVTALSWCMDQLTDGQVPGAILSHLGSRRRDADALVAVGLWHETEGGWEFHDWSEYQRSRASVLGERSAAADRQRRAREKSDERRNASVTGVSRRDSRRDSTRESRSPRPDQTYITTDGLTGESSQGRDIAHDDDHPELETARQPTRSLDRWKPSERCQRVAVSKSLDIGAERERFTAHARANGRTSADWDAAFEGWLLDSAKREKSAAGRPLDRQAEILRREMEAAQAYDAQTMKEIGA